MDTQERVHSFDNVIVQMHFRISDTELYREKKVKTLSKKFLDSAVS